MRAWFAGLLAALAVAWSGSPVRAADAPAAAKGPFVVLVGVGQFQDPAIEPRPVARFFFFSRSPSSPMTSSIHHVIAAGVPRYRPATLTGTMSSPMSRSSRYPATLKLQLSRKSNSVPAFD